VQRAESAVQTEALGPLLHADFVVEHFLFESINEELASLPWLFQKARFCFLKDGCVIGFGDVVEFPKPGEKIVVVHLLFSFSARFCERSKAVPPASPLALLVAAATAWRIRCSCCGRRSLLRVAELAAQDARRPSDCGPCHPVADSIGQQFLRGGVAHGGVGVIGV
jgi:hypothetical protein